VRLHGKHDFRVGTEFLQDAPADFNMRALHLMVNRLADIVQQGSGSCDGNVGAEFFGDHASDVRHLYGVLEHVLPVARSEIQAPQNGNNTRVKIENAALVRRLFALILDGFIDLLTRFFNHLFYFCRLNASVKDEVFKRKPGDMPADRVK